MRIKEMRALLTILTIKRSLKKYMSRVHNRYNYIENVCFKYFY